MYKRSKLLLASWVACALYLIYILAYFLTKIPDTPTIADAIGAGLATILVGPHILITFLALIFNIIGWSSVKPWAALTGAILYCVAAIMFMLYCIFVIPSIVLSFVGFAKMRKAPLYSMPSQGIPAQSSLANDQPVLVSGQRPISFRTQEGDWTDKITPILPLIYVLWFCGIAAGTFFLLSLIFK